MGPARHFRQRTTFTFSTEQPVVTCERIRPQDAPEGAKVVAPGVFPTDPVSTRTRPPEALTSPHSGHSGHTSRCGLFLPFLCPVPALLLVCHQCERGCGQLLDSQEIKNVTEEEKIRAIEF